MDHPRRLAGLQEQMSRRGLGLVAYGPSGDFQYLTDLELGWRAKEAEGPSGAIVLVPREGPPVLILPGPSADPAGQTWIEDVRTYRTDAELGALLRQALRDLDANGGGVAIGHGPGGRPAEVLREAAGDADLREAAGLMAALRVLKEPEEVRRLRAVARLTDQVFDAIVPRIREGMTQGDLEAEIALQGKRLGAEGVSFSPAAIYTKSGSEPAPEPFVYPREKGLVAGTAIAFDFGFVKDGYCSDFGRSLYFGDAPAHIREAYAALQQSVVETVGRMRDGSMRMCDLFPAVEASLDARGYGGYLRARLPDGVLGHNIGIEVHEDPWMRPDRPEPIRAAMVMAMEPKLWHSGEYYLRVEDLVLVGEDGAEFLTQASRDVFQL